MVTWWNGWAAIVKVGIRRAAVGRDVASFSVAVIVRVVNLHDNELGEENNAARGSVQRRASEALLSR
jgi:hypothetical protein